MGSNVGVGPQRACWSTAAMSFGVHTPSERFISCARRAESPQNEGTTLLMDKSAFAVAIPQKQPVASMMPQPHRSAPKFEVEIYDFLAATPTIRLESVLLLCCVLFLFCLVLSCCALFCFVLFCVVLCWLDLIFV